MRAPWHGGREGGLQCTERVAQASAAMGVIGGPFVPLLVGDQRHHGGAVEHRLRQCYPQQQAQLHRAEGHRLRWQQGQPVLQAGQRLGGVQAIRPRRLLRDRARCAGPPLSG
jgi:hypothetical protein